MVELIVSAVGELIAVMFDVIIQMLMPLLGFSFDTFVDAFPFAAKSYTIFQAMGLGIVLLIAAVQLIPYLFGGARIRNSPLRIGLGVVIGVAGVYYGNYILTAIMDIAKMSYMAFMEADAHSWGMDIDFWGLVSAGITDLFYKVSIPLYIIALILIGIAFVKLILEAIERYVVMMVLTYLSPLAFSTLASEETSGVFKRFFGMFVSQCILMVLTIWSLKMAVSMFSGLGHSSQRLMALFVGYAFLRVAGKMDSYLNQLGLNAAITGAGMGAELLAGGMTLAAGAGAVFGGGMPKFGGAAGGVLGAAQAASNFIGKINPMSGVGAGIGAAVSAVGRTVAQATSQGAQAASGGGSFRERVSSGFSGFSSAFSEGIKKNLHAAGQRTKNSSLLFRAFSDMNPNSSDHQTVENMASGSAPLTTEQLNDVATTPYLADRCFNALNTDESTGTTDAAQVASVMQGTGLEAAAPEARDAINAAFGNTEADNVSCSLDQNGASMQYSANGMTEAWNVRNAEQYNALSEQEQHAYTPYKNPNGTRYYYSHTSSRTPSEAAQRQSQSQSEVEQFTQNPSGNPISSSTFSDMQRHPEHLNTMFGGLQTNNTRVDYSSQNNDQFAGVVESTRFIGIPANARQDLANSMRADDLGEHGTAAMSGNGMQAEWESNGKLNRITVLTEAGARANGMDASNLVSRGYSHTNVNGNSYWAKHEQRPVGEDPVDRNLDKEHI